MRPASAYPLSATVFGLMQKPAERTRNGAALDFFRWSLKNGAKTAAQLGYVPLPPGLVKKVSE
jgi:phosphate transport system substrate-binding protein